MDLAVAYDEEQMRRYKMATYEALSVLAEAAKDYAESALHASQQVMDLAVDGAPVASAYNLYEDVTKSCQASNRALAAFSALADLMVDLNDTPDEEAKAAYSMHVIDMANTTVVSAILEGVTRRINYANSMITSPAVPGTRFARPTPPPPPATTKPPEPS